MSEDNKLNTVVLNVYDEQYKTLNKNEDNILNEDNEDNEEDVSNNLENESNKTWKSYHENILIDWADKALCYRWLHGKSLEKYVWLRNMYTIPVIIMSTLTGTANFAIERVPVDYRSWVQIGIGSINILAGLITTISQFLKINELSEAHRVASISWDKFYRNIRIELSKAQDDRTNVTYLIKTCRDEYDRLMETSPDIDKIVIKKFNITFNTKKSKDMLESLSKPEILDTLVSTRNILYKETQEDIDNKIKVENAKQKTEEKEQKVKEHIVDNFVQTFKKEYSRKPSILEIYDNLDNKVDNKTVDKYLLSNKWK
jgi:hypothetical protein